MAKPASSDATRGSSTASVIKPYSLPLILFVAAMFFQLFVVPKSFPPSHYDILGIRSYSSIEEVKEAYDNISSVWSSDGQALDTSDFIKIEYAYELLTNPVWKRNYDIFSIDEQILRRSQSDIKEKAFRRQTFLARLCSFGCKSCGQFSDVWKKIAAYLDGVANTGMLELGELQLATHFAERKPTGQPFFRNGLPSLVAFPLGCKSVNCFIRYEGELSVDSVTDWFATTVLGLPRILYYSKETLGQKFLAKVSLHKVKVIFFSKTGVRAAPFRRQTAKNYWSHASFAFVLWFEVESAPAIVILKDPGVKPVVYHGSVNYSRFLNIMEQNRQQELPQLRSTTSMELSCDSRGYSRAGYDTVTWYCAVVAGRHSPELSNMRGTICRVEEKLSNEVETRSADEEQSIAPAAGASKSKRLTLGLTEKPRRNIASSSFNLKTSMKLVVKGTDMVDVPQLFIVRYKMIEEGEEPEKKPKTIWDGLQDQELDPASRLVAKYNGSDNTRKIIKWISETIYDGDSRDLPHYRTRTPHLVPEDSEPMWLAGVQRIPSTNMIMQSIRGIFRGVYDCIGDPRVGPMLLVAALMSFGTIWLRRSQATPVSSQPNQPNSTVNIKCKKDESRRRRDRARNVLNEDLPPSITDMEPRDSYEMLLSGSDSE